MNKENKKRLHDLAIQHLKQRYPSFPESFIPVPKYSDSSANALTKTIVEFLQYSGHQAERINTMGRPIDNRKQVIDVLGRSRTIGSMEWGKSTSTKGSSDISSTIFGYSVKIEIKYGKDKQSKDQAKYAESVNSAGGVYFIATDFDMFILWYDVISEKLKSFNQKLF